MVPPLFNYLAPIIRVKKICSINFRKIRDKLFTLSDVSSMKARLIKDDRKLIEKRLVVQFRLSRKQSFLNLESFPQNQLSANILRLGKPQQASAQLILRMCKPVFEIHRRFSTYLQCIMSLNKKFECPEI